MDSWEACWQPFEKRFTYFLGSPWLDQVSWLRNHGSARQWWAQSKPRKQRSSPLTSSTCQPLILPHEQAFSSDMSSWVLLLTTCLTDCRVQLSHRRQRSAEIADSCHNSQSFGGMADISEVVLATQRTCNLQLCWQTPSEGFSKGFTSKKGFANVVPDSFPKSSRTPPQLLRFTGTASAYWQKVTEIGGFQRGVFVRGGNLNNWGGCAHRLQ